jgi:hypothetical protein
MTREQFYQICDSLVPDEYGCKHWPGVKGRNVIGYNYSITVDGESDKVSRFALERKLGRRIRPRQQCRHTCGCGSCVNLDHLKEGAVTLTLADVYCIFDSIEPDKFGCHEWPRPRGVRGYHVLIQISHKRYKVHRLALERKLGRPIKPWRLAIHDCDNPSCVNPAHLREGTHKDNTQDMILRNPEWLEGLKKRLAAINRQRAEARRRKKTKP